MMFVDNPPISDFFWWYRAKYMGLYDADTIYVNLDMGRGHWDCGLQGKGIPIRLWGINTPELRGEERLKGLAAKAYAEDLLPDIGEAICLRSIKDRTGKYGRYLAEVFIPANGAWINLNKELLDAGHAEVPSYL